MTPFQRKMHKKKVKESEEEFLKNMENPQYRKNLREELMGQLNQLDRLEEMLAKGTN